MKKTIVVSAINFFEGGPLSILNDCLDYLSVHLSEEYRIVALVHERKLLKARNVEYIEFPKSRDRWIYRLYYEYLYFFTLSKKIQPYLWLSLHDITPNVKADVRAVYCHNPSPFYSFSFRTLIHSYQVALFSLFYKYLYRINIGKNNFVVVQQDWIRSEFKKMYGIENVVVAYPGEQKISIPERKKEELAKTTFIYPAFPRIFKNIEIVAEAAKILFSEGRNDFSVILTIDGRENGYSRGIVSRYRDTPAVSFVGLKSRDEIFQLYQNVHGLIFPSKLETWGLPITEFKSFGKPMFLADLPYAHETVGEYEKVSFFDPENPRQLADLMKDFLDDKVRFQGNRKNQVNQPFSESWKGLFEILLAARRGKEETK